MLVIVLSSALFVATFIIICAAVSFEAQNKEVEKLQKQIKGLKEVRASAIKLKDKYVAVKAQLGEAASLTAKQTEKIKELKKKVFDLEAYQAEMAKEYEEMYKDKNYKERLRIVNGVLNSIHELAPALLAEVLAGKTYVDIKERNEV